MAKKKITPINQRWAWLAGASAVIWIIPFLVSKFCSDANLGLMVLMAVAAIDGILFLISLLGLCSARRRTNPWIVLSLSLSALFIAGGVLMAASYRGGPGP